MTMKNETLPNPTPAKKYEFGKAFNNIMLFPFRLVKYTFNYSTRIVSIVLLIGIIAMAIRSAFPMNLPEAKGMTYYQFVEHRWTSIMDDPREVRKGVVLSSFGTIPMGFLTIRIPVIFSELYPDTEFSRWVDKAVIGESASTEEREEYILPYPATWRNLPRNLWDSWETENWNTLVKNRTSYPPMTFPDTVN